MRRKICFLLVIVMIISAYSLVSAQDDMYIGLTFPTFSTDYYNEIVYGINEICAEKGIRFDSVSCEQDAYLQKQQIENFVTMGITHLIIQSTNMGSLEDALIDARRKGVYVCSYGYTPNDPDSVDIVAGYLNSFELGALAAKEAAKWIDAVFPDAEDGSIEVAVVQKSLFTGPSDRSEGLKTIADYSSKARIVEIFDLLGFTDCSTKTQEFVDTMMVDHPDIKAILCYDAACAVGANEASMRNPNVDPSEFGIFACDFTKSMGDLILLSRSDDAVLRSAVKIGDDVPAMLVNSVLGLYDDQIDKRKRACLMNLYPITTDNIDEFYDSVKK